MLSPETQSSSSSGQAAEPAAKSAPLRLALFEVVWILLIFFLFAGSPPPDVGESHYLTKARHYWQPDWCAGDLFLEAKDAHWTFYWTFGWITQFTSLTAAAWIGRVITWSLLAWSWQRLSWVIVPRPLFSLLSAGLMLFFLRNGHMAGEWIVGGVEAKGPAYVLVFLALEAIVRARWRVALLLVGAAGAFHVLVGGWAAVAIGLAWLVAGKERPPLLGVLPAAVGGAVLALPGLIPALTLNFGIADDIARQASRIYVFERLPHHLVFHRFETWNIARHAALLLFWVVLFRLWRTDATRRLNRVVLGTIVIGAIGVLIDQVSLSVILGRGRPIDDYESLTAPLLRYYWFRLSDAMLPIGTSLAICAAIARAQVSRPRLGNWLIVAAMLVACLNLTDICYMRAVRRVPGAVLQPRPTYDSHTNSALESRRARPDSDLPTPDLREWLVEWNAVSQWASESTPPDAKFLTPRSQQTFKWYAGRAEVASWKDVPQDAAGLIAWQAAITDLYPRTPAHQRYDLAAFTDAELVSLGEKYGASYVIIDRTRSNRKIDLPRVYPVTNEEQTLFEVYRLPKRRLR